MLPLSDAWLSWGAERLIAASLQGAIAAAVVWFICRRVTTIPPAIRALLWWLVSLKLVLSLVSLPSLPVPLLPAARIDVAGEVITASTVQRSSDVAGPRVRVAPASRDDAASTVRIWMIAGIGLWFAGVVIHAVRLLWTFATLRRTRRESTRVGDEDAAIAARMARQLGLRVTPDVRVAARVNTPFVVGLLRPTVLLPEHAITTLTPDERAMAICHELAHVRRRDLLLGWVPAIAERLFFFHPLARLAAREYAAEREAACDALVLQAMGVAPRDYGQMLVRLGVSGLTPVFTASGSSPSRSVLRRRLDMLNDVTFTRSRRGAIVLIAVVSALAFMPFHLVAQGGPAPAAAAPAQVRPVQTPTQAPQTAPPKQAAPVGAAQAPAEKRPVRPAPARADAEQIQKAIEEQTANMRAAEQALMKMRLAVETMVAEQERLKPGADPKPAAEVASIRQVEAQLRAELTRAAQQSLENQLAALKAEQERTSAALRALQEQIEQISKKLELAGRVNQQR